MSTETVPVSPSSLQDPLIEPADPDVVLDLLGLLVRDPSVLPSAAMIATWPQSDRDDVAHWASMAHLRASDNNVDVPAAPAVIRDIEGLGVPIDAMPALTEEQMDAREAGTDDTPATETVADPPPARSMRCEACGGQVRVERLPSGHGFKVLAIEHAAPGYAADTAFGISANGFPICPTDGVALIPLGPVPVGEAFAAVGDATAPAAPVQQRLPGTVAPFNIEKAYRAEHRLRQEVRYAEEEFEEKNAAAKEAKKDLERVQEQLGKLMDENERREREAGLERRGTLLPEQDSVCLYEQRTGQPCPICREARKRVKEDESHDVGDLRVASLHEHLARRGVHLTEFELLQLAAEDNLQTIKALEAFAHDDKAKLPPFVLERSCVAGPAGEEGQRCTTCGVVLHNKTDEDEVEAKPYPEGDRVGLDCAGDPNAEAAGGDVEPEPARTLPKRHKTTKAAAQAKSQGARAAKAEKPAKAKTAKKQRARSR